MARSERSPTRSIALEGDLLKTEADQPTHCPYCKQPLENPNDALCPHCNLPLRRRKRGRQITAHGGALARLIVAGAGQDNQEVLLSKQITTLGRDKDNLIQLDSLFVSNHHAQVELTESGHALTDLGSTNGTRLNGQVLAPHKPHLLAANDIIRFSDSRGNSIKLTYLPPASYTHVDTKHARQSYQLDGDLSYIGRGFDAAILLSHPTVSWYHAKITKRAEDEYFIEDVSTHNGTFLNGTRLQAEQPLARGDVVQIGPYNLIYQDHGIFSFFVAERNFRLEVENLEKTVYGVNLLGLRDLNQPKKILQNLNLVVNPREFVALVGGSGSGKSTLMKALIGLSPATAGKVLVNGDDLYETLEMYRHLIGYVPQDDIVHANLPVRQALRYAYQLRLPETKLDDGEKQIEAVLAKVGLTAQAGTLVRDLSGGQRKRVSIAAELLADPWIFFLDEPTSGLDPGLEKLMMDTLRHLADEGRTIILVTHATNHIIGHCDQVAFMGRGGKLAYFGPPEQAMTFFGVDNFPDIYTALAQTYSRDDGTTVPPELQPVYAETIRSPLPEQPAEIEAGWLWAAKYRDSEIYQTHITHRQSGEVARPIPQESTPVRQSAQEQFRQFKILARRYLDLIKADRLGLWVLLAVMPLIGVFLLLINQSQVLVGHSPEASAAILEASGSYSIAAETQTVLFMMALSTALLGIFGAGYELIKEEAVYRRERMINLRVAPYFASKLVVLGGFMALQLILFLIVLSLKIELPGSGAIFWAPLEYYLTLTLTVLASVALGLFISALASSKDMVTYLILIAILIQIVFSGAIFKLSALTEFFSYLTITRWSLEALGISTNIQALNQLGQVRVENVIDTGRGLQTLVKDVPTTLEFFVNYTYNPLALISRWILLLTQILVWSNLTLWQIRRKDEI
ncbi:MAG: FHA domain-containing protein [Anaerolineae bacterium]